MHHPLGFLYSTCSPSSSLDKLWSLRPRVLTAISQCAQDVNFGGVSHALMSSRSNGGASIAQGRRLNLVSVFRANQLEDSVHIIPY